MDISEFRFSLLSRVYGQSFRVRPCDLCFRGEEVSRCRFSKCHAKAVNLAVARERFFRRKRREKRRVREKSGGQREREGKTVGKGEVSRELARKSSNFSRDTPRLFCHCPVRRWPEEETVIPRDDEGDDEGRAKCRDWISGSKRKKL